MKLSSNDLLNLGVIDEIILEPIGGAHRDKDLCLDNVKKSIQKNLNEMKKMNREEIFLQRKNKFLSIGRSKGFSTNLEKDKNLVMKENFIEKSLSEIKKNKIIASIIVLIVILAIIYSFL